MENLLSNLYDALGLDLEDDEAALLVDEELLVHLEESEQGLEMICPLCELPNDVAVLHRVLQRNYVGPVVLAADAEAEVLLAVVRMSDDSSGAELTAALDSLIQAARAFRSEMDPVEA